MDNETLLLTPQICDMCAAYKQYKSSISEFVAYIEVYEHDLPEGVMAEIAELFQMLAFYETENQDVQKDDMDKTLQDTVTKVKQSLCLHATCLFINKIEEYKKIFRKHKYKGVMVGNTNFVDIAKKSEKDISKSFGEKLKLFYKGKVKIGIQELSFKNKVRFLLGYLKVRFKPSFKTFKKEPYFPKTIFEVNNIEKENLLDVYKNTKELMEMYQEVLPSVISNGTNKTLFISIFIAITGWLIPIALLIPTIIKMIGGE